MLLRLSLEQFVLLEKVELTFDPGLNVISGETGTGKSILCDAIGLIAGARGDASWIRTGAERTIVEGDFQVDRLPGAARHAAELGAEARDGRLLLRRELQRGGRGRAWIQGRPVRLADLRAVGAELLDIHGQGEHRRLLEPAAQLELVDRFAGTLGQRELYAAARALWTEEKTRVEEAGARLAELRDKGEWVRLQLEEIDAARIQPGEAARLRALREGLRDRISALEGRGLADRILFEEEGAALERIETVLHRCESLGEEWDAFRREIERAREAMREARGHLPDPNLLEEEDPDAIEKRLAEIGRLERKYGGSEEAILARRAEMIAQVEEEERLEGRLAGLDLAAGEARTRASAAAARLRAERRRAAEPLCRAVLVELAELGMPQAALSLAFEEEEVAEGEGLMVDGRNLRAFADGIDRAWLRLRPNPGEGEGALASVASGGELSRSLLALLTVLGAREEPRSAVFDEVDAGVGGTTARALAQRLERLAGQRQVLLVTHLPVVAARAIRHLRVEKSERNGRTYATIECLAHEQRIDELARMLAGEVESTIARKHAETLLAAASESRERG